MHVRTVGERSSSTRPKNPHQTSPPKPPKPKLQTNPAPTEFPAAPTNTFVERSPNFNEGSSTPLKVVCCYAREDQEMLTQLKKHLAALQRQGRITIWSDTDLNAGVEWERELHKRLESADIILLLISADFMASDYCYITEMGQAIERYNEGSVQVIPILLRPTLWWRAPFAKLQMAPTNEEPITKWLDRDDALLDVTLQVDRVVSELRSWPNATDQ